ncbi:hypothetical protein NUW58_g2714 [Xylaria curta]|uniref:Uncharacterized protein n=1 Tax=Xylaria curta TaxID=42375 RepID=A0ACC1PHG9_9PEZI|nr:hypothetical protein NUW58_g2714 [Xylaria curta]
MAELAGLALGALPIAIWALEKYSEPFETLHRYRTTIEIFRSQIIIQHYQLEKTISNLGLGKDASREELRECFEAKFPQISHDLMLIVQQMDEVTMELIGGLDVSLSAKPDSLSDKAQWNWSRVKHSLNTKKRNKILESLRHQNEDLRRIVDRAELPEEADSSKIRELKLRFSSLRCSSIRRHLSSLHRALGACLCCACPSSHQAAIDLDWEAYESAEKQVYKVAVSCKKNTQPPQHIDSWKKVHIAPIAPQTAPISLLSHVSECLHPHQHRRDPPASLQLSSISANDTPSTEVTNLCDVVCNENAPHNMISCFKDPDKDPDTDDHQRFSLDPNRPGLNKVTEVFHFKNFISLGNVPGGKPNPIHSLSAKQRYGIAAAIAWSVLHLGETPWLGQFWSEKQAVLFLEKSRRSEALDLPKPYFSYIFSMTQAPEERPSSELDELIPNKVIFALGVLMVELCMIELKPGSLIEDYRAAMSRLDEVRRIAGSAYGDAAERCVKFSFPGPNMYKNFSVLQFRR